MHAPSAVGTCIGPVISRSLPSGVGETSFCQTETSPIYAWDKHAFKQQSGRRHGLATIAFHLEHSHERSKTRRVSRELLESRRSYTNTRTHTHTTVYWYAERQAPRTSTVSHAHGSSR